MLVACYLLVVALFTLTTGLTYPILVLFAASAVSVLGLTVS